MKIEIPENSNLIGLAVSGGRLRELKKLLYKRHIPEWRNDRSYQRGIYHNGK
jgi:hypothetical protein